MLRSIEPRRSGNASAWWSTLGIRRILVLLFSVLVAPAMFASCQRYQKWHLGLVTGTVTRAGQAVAGIQVCFLPDRDAGVQGPRSAAVTNASGRYELVTDAGDRGVATGRYRVCLLELRAAERYGLAKMPKEVANKVKTPKFDSVLVPSGYSSFVETPLRAEVHAGSQTLNFEIP